MIRRRPPRPALLTVAQAAERLGLTAWRVRQFVADGRLPATRYGQRQYLITEEALEAFAAVPRPAGRRWPAKKNREKSSSGAPKPLD